HALELAVMMRAGLGIRSDADGARPDLLRADASVVDRGLAIHAGRLRRVGVERRSRDHADAVVFPFGFAHGRDAPSIGAVLYHALDGQLLETRASCALSVDRNAEGRRQPSGS